MPDSSRWEAALCVLTRGLRAVVVFVEQYDDGAEVPASLLRVPSTSCVAFERNGNYLWLQRRAGSQPVRSLVSGVTSDIRARFLVARRCRDEAFRLARACGCDAPAVAQFSVPGGRGIGAPPQSMGVPVPPSTPERGGKAAAALTTPEAAAPRSAATTVRRPTARSGPPTPWSQGTVCDRGSPGVGPVAAEWVGDLASPSLAAHARRAAAAAAADPAALTPSVPPSWPWDGAAPDAARAGPVTGSAAAVAAAAEADAARGVMVVAPLALALASYGEGPGGETAAPRGWDGETAALASRCCRAVATASPVPASADGVLVVASQRFVAAAAPAVAALPFPAGSSDALPWLLVAAPRDDDPGAAEPLAESLRRASLRLCPGGAGVPADVSPLLVGPALPEVALLADGVVARGSAGGVVVARRGCLSPLWGGDLSAAATAVGALGSGSLLRAGGDGGGGADPGRGGLERRVREAVEAARALRDVEWHPAEQAAAAARAARDAARLAGRQRELEAALLECRRLSVGIVA